MAITSNPSRAGWERSEFIVFLRPVKSRILWEQMLGRGTRLWTPLTLPEVIENIWQNVDRDYHVRILAKRLLRIDKDMNADARTQFAAWIGDRITALRG